MVASPKGECLGWECSVYADERSVDIRNGVRDDISAGIGLDTQDKCEKVEGCYYATPLGRLAGENNVVLVEGGQNA